MVSVSTGELIKQAGAAGDARTVSTSFSSSFFSFSSISPGNIWTPLWEELAASTSDPSATILEGTLAQVGAVESWEVRM